MKRLSVCGVATLFGSAVIGRLARPSRSNRHLEKRIVETSHLIAALGVALCPAAPAIAQAYIPDHVPETIVPATGSSMLPVVVMTRRFPAGAMPIADPVLRASLTGKTAAMYLSDGQKLTYEFKDNGFVRMKSSAGVDVQGPWQVAAGKICVRPLNLGSYCGETRVSEGVLYMRRENGEVLAFEAP